MQQEPRFAGNTRQQGVFMGKRQDRQELITQLICAEAISTQAELAARLNEEGMECTQATVSRDIVDMRLEKNPQGCYVLPEQARLRRVAADVVLSAHAAGNLVVIKTRPAGSDTLADALDKANLHGSLGTIAGEDTIFLAAETQEDARAIQQNLLGYIQ